METEVLVIEALGLAVIGILLMLLVLNRYDWRGAGGAGTRGGQAAAGQQRQAQRQAW